MEAEAVSNDRVFENEAAGATKEDHATNAELNENLAEQFKIEHKQLMQDKVIKEVLNS